VAEPSSSDRSASSRGGGLADALRRYVDAVVGVTEVSRERAEKIIGDLARRGETRTKDIQKAARDLADRSARNQRDLARLIQKEIKRQIETLGLATRDDVGRLQRRMKELEGSGAEETHVAKKPSAPKKKPARKKPAKAAAARIPPSAARKPSAPPSPSKG
jgi:polyhydroxyalkanoate synthesis regulator phasin